MSNPTEIVSRWIDAQPEGALIRSPDLEHLVNRDQASRQLARLARQGRLMRVARGAYLAVRASRDDHMLWAKSNKAALKSGAYFATRRNTIELPGGALAHSNNTWAASQQQTARAQLWFSREPESMQVNEMIRVAGQYDYTLTLLLLPEAEWQGAHHDDEEPEEDTYDRFIRNGQFPVR